jgi:8-oxo-dGTP pyrophosphatase MutT (NUDIX family)
LQYRRTRLFLIVWARSDGNGGNPGLPKGGIKPGETIFEAALRELKEEVGVERKHVVFRGYGGTRSVKSLNLREGFTQKRYFIVCASYFGPRKLKVDPNELSGYDWLTQKGVDKALAKLHGMRPDKEQVSHEAVAMAARLIRKRICHRRI